VTWRENRSPSDLPSRQHWRQVATSGNAPSPGESRINKTGNASQAEAQYTHTKGPSTILSLVIDKIMHSISSSVCVIGYA
jgi:hypothetical protein